MRISDLVSFIRIASAQNAGVPLSAETWLGMARKGFPRRDLLDWFNPPAISPALYFPALLVASTLGMARSGTVVKTLTVEADTRFAAAAALFVCAPDEHIGIDMRDGAELALPVSLPCHEAALVVGVFDQESAAQAVALRLLWTRGWPHAAQLYFFTGDVFRSWRDSILPAADNQEVYRGLLQDAAGHEIFLVFRETAGRLPARPRHGA